MKIFQIYPSVARAKYVKRSGYSECSGDTSTPSHFVRTGPHLRRLEARHLLSCCAFASARHRRVHHIHYTLRSVSRAAASATKTQSCLLHFFSA